MPDDVERAPRGGCRRRPDSFSKGGPEAIWLATIAGSRRCVGSSEVRLQPFRLRVRTNQRPPPARQTHTIPAPTIGIAEPLEPLEPLDCESDGVDDGAGADAVAAKAGPVVAGDSVGTGLAVGVAVGAGVGVSVGEGVGVGLRVGLGVGRGAGFFVGKRVGLGGGATATAGRSKLAPLWAGSTPACTGAHNANTNASPPAAEAIVLRVITDRPSYKRSSCRARQAG
jgi:hypothetical protein